MTMKLRLALLGGAIGFATVPSIASAADATATAGIEATVVKPIAITKTADLNFGSFAPDDNTTGTVVLSTDGARTFTGASAVSSGAGTVTAASFNVTGEGTSTFSISLPTAAVTLTHTTITTSPPTMSVGTFVSAPATTGTLVGGSKTVTVGATLSVAANQATGVYANTSGLPVTVAYN